MKAIRQAVILAAGMGERLGETGKAIPKGLMSVGGQTLVPRSVELLRLVGITQIVISTGHLAEQYADAFTGQADVVCVPHDQYKTTGSMQSLYSVRDVIQEDFLLLESDILYEPVALKELLNHSQDTVVLVSHLTGAGDECYVGVDDAGQLVNISKKKEEVEEIGGELVGVSRVSHNTLMELCMYWEQVRDKQPGIHYEDGLVGVAPIVPVAVHKVDGLVWCEIDTPEHMRRAKSLILPALLVAEGVRV